MEIHIWTKKIEFLQLIWGRNNMGKLDKKVALITGAARGIGKQIALTFAREGADVVIADIIEMEAVATEIRDLGRRVITIEANVSKISDVEDLFARSIATFKKVDILVNNAGIPGRATLMEMTEDAWDNVLNVNLKGVLFCTQAAAKHMMKQKYGKIINIASLAGTPNAYFQRMAPNYATSKAGVIRFTNVCSKELGAYGINVNAIAPGFVETDITHSGRSLEEVKKFIEQEVKQTPIGRAGTPQDIANLALFLASEDSTFITGQTIVADGGRS
jgi:3-oxoacyl-[acyl-carrier protein] reductase